MARFKKLSRIVDIATGEIISQGEEFVKSRAFVNEKFAFYFRMSFEKIAMLPMSAAAFRLSFILMANLQHGNEVIIDVKTFEQTLGIKKSACYKALGELAKHHVLLVNDRFAPRKIYRLNPRLVWNTHLEKRPVDLSSVPEIG